MTRFIDTNVFIHSATAHPQSGLASRAILERVEGGETAVTSTLVLCEVAWILEAMGKQGEIKPMLEKILSHSSLEVASFTEDDMLVGANNMMQYHVDFNDGLDVAIMERLGFKQAYSNDKKHLET